MFCIIPSEIACIQWEKWKGEACEHPTRISFHKIFDCMLKSYLINYVLKNPVQLRLHSSHSGYTCEREQASELHQFSRNSDLHLHIRTHRDKIMFNWNIFFFPKDWLLDLLQWQSIWVVGGLCVTSWENLDLYAAWNGVWLVAFPFTQEIWLVCMLWIQALLPYKHVSVCQ